MRTNSFLLRTLSVLTLAIMLVGSAAAQGKGNKHGGGGGKHGGGPPGQQKHGDRGGDRGGDRSHPKQERQQMGGWQGGNGGGQGHLKQERRQMGEWQGAGEKQNKHFERQQRRMQQPIYVQPQQRVYIQPQQRVYVQPQQNWGQIRRQQAFEAKRYRDAMKSERHAERNDWKFAKKQQHFDDKAFRKAEKQYRKSVRPIYPEVRGDTWRSREYDNYRPSDRTYDRYADAPSSYDSYQRAPRYQQYPSYDNYQNHRSYPSYENYPSYSTGIFDYSDDVDNYYTGSNDNGGLDWKSMLFRSVLAMFFSNGNNGGYLDPYPQYANYDDGYGYEPEYDYARPTYNTFGYAPQYAYYEPAAYYGYDQYSGNGLPYEAFAGSLPYNDVAALYSGGLAGELIQRALGTGYYQGLLEGQAARRRGWGDRYYSDPYLYEQAMYDPYSSSIGDCRRYFSEGYEMGYHDALGGRDEFDLAKSGGDIDLVSLLLGSVLDFRG